MVTQQSLVPQEGNSCQPQKIVSHSGSNIPLKSTQMSQAKNNLRLKKQITQPKKQYLKQNNEITRINLP